jgi:hypothetical protein
MSVIRVNPESVRGYGRDAEGVFGEMYTSLTKLVNEVVDVHYFGPNAVKFKTDCGQIAASFAASLNKDISAMADAVRQSTSNIAASLGGAAIDISIANKVITPPTPTTVDYVDVDTSALTALTTTVTSRFNELNAGLEKNLSRLQATDWVGNAKEQAVSMVSGYTNSAKAKCTEAQTQINNYITSQVNAATAADK